MRERREEAKDGARKHRDIALVHHARNSPCDRRERGGFVFLALAAQGYLPPDAVAYVRYWGRPVSWWSVKVVVEVVVKTLEIVIRN